MLSKTKSFQWFTLGLFLLLAVRNTHEQGVCPGTSVGDVTPATRTDFTTTYGTDNSFLLPSKGVINCYGYIDRWQWYYGDQGGTCNDITFQVWRPVDLTAQSYVLVAENTLVAGVDWPCIGGGGVVTYPVYQGQQIPVIPGDIYGWKDATGTRRPIEFDEDPLPGSGLYGINLVLSSGDSCAYTVGSSCSWLSTFSGGQADLYSREFSLNARVIAGNAPYFDNLPAITPLYENSVTGTYVFRAIADYNFNYQPIVEPTMYYAITGSAPAGECNNKFEVDPLTGEITTLAGVDFENLGGGTCTLTVEASFGPVSGTRLLTVSIINVNEAHDIDNLADDIAIDAATTIANSVIFTITESDPDTGGPAKNYRMTNALPYFDLFQLGGPNAINQVSPNQALANWLADDNYTLSLTSFDPYFISGPKDLKVFIYNKRQSPVLTNLPSTISVPETSAAVSVVYDVNGAAQPDGRGNPLAYSIVMVYPESELLKFTINPANGQVSHVINPGFDHFSIPEIKVECQVQDGDGLFSSKTQNLTIEITWVNMAPSFATPIFTTTMPEKEPTGMAVPGVFLDATDRDVVVGDWMVYNLYQAGAYLFRPDNVTHLVFVNGDIGLGPGVPSVTYNLKVQVQDSYGDIDTSDLVITVTDVNDHVPVFNPTSYTGSVRETDVGGTAVGITVTATDDDAGNNAIIVYSIKEDFANLYFEINPSSGSIFLKQPISYVDYPNMTFSVLATDQGTPPLSSNATVFINVIEENTHRPLFSEDFVSIELRSDKAVGSSVLTVVATDLDTDAVNNITYMYIVLQDDFGIGASTGIITVAISLWHYNTYLLYIYAKDNGVPIFYSDPYHVRIDTYDADQVLVDIRLKMPLQDFLLEQDAFMASLASVVSPWTIKMENAVLDGDETIVTVYAMRNNVPNGTDYVAMKKEFVGKNELMSKLRSNIEGSPSTSIRGSSFAAYQPIVVSPARSVWLIDTAAGIAVFVLLLVLILSVLTLGLVCLCKKKRWMCFKHRILPRRPNPTVQGRPPKEDFKLQYDTPKKPSGEEYQTQKELYGRGTGLIPTMPFTQSKPPEKASYISPNKTNSFSNPLIPLRTMGANKTSTRRPPQTRTLGDNQENIQSGDQNSERSLTPVNQPERAREETTAKDLLHA